MAEKPTRAGLLDTSVVIDLALIDPALLPEEVSIASITLAELAAGPHAASNAAERARRQDRLQRVEAAFDPIPFDAGAARAYGRVAASVLATGRTARGARAVDLMIAATALSEQMALYTRNGDVFKPLRALIDIFVV